MNTCENPPQIEFPCDYPIRIFGEASEEFQPRMLAVLEQQKVTFKHDSIRCRPSKAGAFLSLKIVIWAEGKDQLASLFEALKKTGLVKMVL